jgi:hypothetical protein
MLRAWFQLVAVAAGISTASAQTEAQKRFIEDSARASALVAGCPNAEVNGVVLASEAKRVGIEIEDLRADGRFGKLVQEAGQTAATEYAPFLSVTRCSTIAGSLFGPSGSRIKGLVRDTSPPPARPAQQAQAPVAQSSNQRRSASTAGVLSGEDLVLDFKKFIGKRVTVTDCMIVGARLEFAACFVGMPVMINVGYGDADRAVRKRAMERCADVGIRRECFARVTGRVRGSLTGQVVGLDQATIEWTNP